MKRLLVMLLALFILTACGEKKEDVILTPSEDVKIEVVGGWSINEDLPEMNDMIFDNARKELLGVNYSPLFVLGTQVVAGQNIMYLTYATPFTPNAKKEYKIVTVFDDISGENKSEIKSVANFNISDYLQDNGSTTPEGLMGGWQDNGELPNFLNESQQEIFDKALSGLLGVGYTPIALLASQVVAGMNYAFLASGTTVTAEPITHLYIINVYVDINNEVTLTNIHGLDLSSFN